MTWTIDLSELEAVHTSGLRVKFKWHDGEWDGAPVAGQNGLTAENATRLMHEAREAFAEALRASAVKYRCLRCGHGWNPRRINAERPLICPDCKTPYWDRPKKRNL